MARFFLWIVVSVCKCIVVFLCVYTIYYLVFAMSIINVAVVNRIGKLLHPWSIKPIVPGISIKNYFYEAVEPDCQRSATQSERYEIQGAYLGVSKDKLDGVDLSLALDEVAVLFGHFLKVPCV